MKPEEAPLYAPVKVRMYEHQNRAFAYGCNLLGLIEPPVKSRGFALLAEMGTGKSLVAIALTGFINQVGYGSRAVIVAPLSMTGVWAEELEKFANFPYQVQVLRGTMAQKRTQIETIPAGQLQIIIVNYESAWRLEKELLAFAPHIVIADEAHKIKDGKSRQSKMLHKLGDVARYKILLTGTVITNKEIDVFSQYRFLDPRIFGSSFYQFRGRYFEMGGYEHHVPIFRTYMRDEFLRKLHSIAFRVTKAECLDLPETTDEIRTVDLEPKAMQIYKDIQKMSYAELENGEVTTLNVLSRLLRLSQITGGYLKDDDGNMHRVSEAKLKALSDIIDGAAAENKKLVVIARFKAELDDIQALLESKKLSYAVVRGGVQSRSEEVRCFQEDDDCKVFIGQIAAASLGLTLTAASTMVFYSLDYSYSNFDQAKARIHRVSQKENCQYIYLVARGTVDRKVLKTLHDKKDLAKMLVDDYRRGINPFEEE